MKRVLLASKLKALLIPFIAILVGCGEEPAPSLFDPNQPSKPTPIITSIIPPDSALAGVGEIQINGENFSPVKEENLVFFDATKAKVLQASETQLKVKTPNIIGDSIKIKIAVHGAELFSEAKYYKLIPAVTVFGNLLEGEMAFGIAIALDGNVFVSIQGKLIKKITPEGKTSIFTQTSFLKANGMKMGPGNTIYAAVAAGRARSVSMIAPDGTESRFMALSGNPQDLDFDIDGNIWVASGTDLIRVKPDKTIETLASYPVTLQTVRIFRGFVNVAGKNSDTGEEKIWRSEIQGDQLGAQEVVLDIAAAEWLEGASVQAITFSEDGEMYLGTDHPNGIFILREDGSHEPLYPGLIQGNIYALSWSEGPLLFAVHQSEASSKILKINTGKKGAPYYGRK